MVKQGSIYVEKMAILPFFLRNGEDRYREIQEVGRQVKPGDPLVVIEAMKMAEIINSPNTGYLDRISSIKYSRKGGKNSKRIP